MKTRHFVGYMAAVPAALTLLSALLPTPAAAALGLPETSVGDDVRQMKATVKSTPRTAYRVHEIQLPSGTVVREFSSPGGKVFAVAWQGPSLPNLKQTLGEYFDAYVAGQKLKRGGRGQIEIRQTGLVVQSGGHMRAFAGRAYVPQAIPEGVSMDELR